MQEAGDWVAVWVNAGARRGGWVPRQCLRF